MSKFDVDDCTQEELLERLRLLIVADEMCEENKILKRFEFSKAMLGFVSTIVLLLTGFLMYMMWTTGDLSPASYLVVGWFAEFATATAFYYWKAKAENIIKISGGKNTIKINDPFGEENSGGGY